MTMHSNLLVLNNPSASLNITQETVSALSGFKASENKNDPARRQGIHGPYEELTIRKTGKLPADYFQEGDVTPWGLRVEESRSNILWQVIKGVIDHQADFAAAYMALALDNALGDDDYTKELQTLNKEWGDFQMKGHFHAGAQHTAMSHIYGSVACPACSVLTALAVRDSGMKNLFQDMQSMKPQDRRVFLKEKGLLGMLDTMIPDQEEQIAAKNIIK